MTFHKKLRFVVLSSIFLAACSRSNNKSNKYSLETQRFNRYLSESFGKSLDDDSCTYVLLSSNGCVGCVKSFLNMLTGEVLNSHVRYIIPYKLLTKNNLEDSLLNNYVMIDKRNVVDRLPYHKGNIAILESANKKLYNIYAIQPNQTDSVLSLISQ